MQAATKNKTTYKTSVTTKEYSVKYQGYDLVVPVGSKVSNSTACGNDDSYHFWSSWHEMVEKITGFKNSILAHDLTHYGLKIPAEHCQPYAKEQA